jgi:hypothetical protein
MLESFTIDDLFKKLKIDIKTLALKLSLMEVNSLIKK